MRASSLLSFRRPGPRVSPRLADAIAAEEQAGLVFAFWARTVAAIAVALWLPVIVPAPRVYYYLAFVGAFFLFGLIPYLLRRHRHGRTIKFAVTFLDVVLITAVIIVPPPDLIGIGWPVQMRIRFSEYLYLILLLIGAALSYSPLNVIWTGLCIIVVWSTGVLLLYRLPDTTRFVEAVQGEADADQLLQLVLNPTFVSFSTLMNQVVLTAIATGLLAAAVKRSRSMLLRQLSAEVARADLSRYVSPDVADAMMAGSDDFRRPATRHVAVLFADIVGFTGLVEHLPPARTVALLRNFQERACKIVFDHGGTLDKYLGDGFMATFGGLADEPRASAKALACAFALQAEIDRWCRKRALRGAFPVRVAVGLHYGPVVVGNVGSGQRLEFTVIGDAVNVASRLERLTREHQRRIAVSEACLASARRCHAPFPDFDYAGPIHLRGREQPVGVHLWPATEAQVDAKPPL